MTHPIAYAEWAQGKTDTVPGCTVVEGPAGNEILKDSTGWTRAVRPKHAGEGVLHF
jgi:hypothetical protein